ncbi:MAG: hypothetical protein ABJO36_01420 [Litorimonas sp.]
MNAHIRILALTAATVLATGCATVDMTEISIPVAAKSEAPAERNIVLRAASKLYSVFRSKGFVAKTSRKKMQSAASLLLNGLEDRELTTEVNYVDQNLPRAVVIEDIAFATEQVRLTTNAAEIYFNMSEGERKLREELGELEQALLASHEASKAFKEVVGVDSLELRGLNTEIGRLKTVTDNFGKRVREQAAAEMAARRKETS